MDNVLGKELIVMTKKPQRGDKESESSKEEEQEDYIDDAHPGETREDAIADEQGEESFPASDPPANY